MILSASRRTDIPAQYSDWFMNRLNAGYVLTRNPMNHSQVGKITLSPDAVDCIVFWTKDPKNILPKLSVIDAMGYRYYFQFTLTPYDRTIERNLRDKSDIRDTFARLSKAIGPHKVLWRYDPIILNNSLSADYHEEHFSRLCETLHPYTNSVIVSFVDTYAKRRPGSIREITDEEIIALSERLSAIASKVGLPVKACCERLDLSAYGIEKANCIDKRLIEQICGCKMSVLPDKNQRAGCGCVQSIDIGAYNTCTNGCVYCYANYGGTSVAANCLRHNPQGEFLIGGRLETDKITQRKAEPQPGLL